jgi:hypothetical protein
MREALGFEVGAQVVTKALNDIKGALIVDATAEDAIARPPILRLRAHSHARTEKLVLKGRPRLEFVAI